MISLIATRYRKHIAIIFFTIFYLQLTLPSLARVWSPPTFNWRRTYESNKWMQEEKKSAPFQQPANTPFTSPRTTKGEAEAMQKEKQFIGGPGQPEMSSFKSVNSSEMVDLFSGDFSYNIPLMDVGGYPINIHYNSGISMDQEASWVGLGWNINPGTISRSMRGLPDDFNGTDTVTKTQRIKENNTVGVSVGADVEIVGTPFNVGATIGIFSNTYNGWGRENGINASINSGSKSYGPLSGGLSLTNNTQQGLTVHPSLGVKLSNGDREVRGAFSLGLSTSYNSRAGISGLQLNTSVRLERKLEQDQMRNLRGASVHYPYAGISFAIPSYTPSISMPYTSTHYSFRAKIGGEGKFVHPSGIIEGYVTKQEIKVADQVQAVPAVGYLYYAKANKRLNTLLDFNREKELSFNAKTTPHIAIPQYTYDVYAISGEGTGGMFRPFRGDVGFMRDNKVSTKSESDKYAIDLGFGDIFHAGVDFSFTNAYTENGAWKGNNDINKHLSFGESDTTFQAVYFRNPGEKTTNTQTYYASIGDDSLMRVKLTGNKENIKAATSFYTFDKGRKIRELPVTQALVKKERDKRSQVISYLTASEASRFGLDKHLLSYKENSIPFKGCSDTITPIARYDGKIRKEHHISQISVLNGDGRTYVYGIPAYNIEQKDVTFSVDKETNADHLEKGLVEYTPGIENSGDNPKGKEGLYSKDSLPAYAHSFLLSGLLSPDYVDVLNDGITEDDLGDAVKFNYTRVYGGNNNHFEWRTPFEYKKANYNEGLKSYNRDDKGTYLYGKKEVWYLNSVESKTMMAVFSIKNDRKDIYSVNGENGGLNTAKSLRRLEKIDLYTKADLTKHGLKAKPIKTVHFEYTYTLCKGAAGDVNLGKLTLQSIWFSYNKNQKGKLNPYVFRYPESSAANPSYNPKHYDRWGNYKNPSTNPGQLSNIDYPYAEQNKQLADTYAAAWTLQEIKLPSGGTLKITYESDDYGYVQHKRAAQFFQIAAITRSADISTGFKLYKDDPADPKKDNFYVHVNSPVVLMNRQDIFTKYLQGNEFIYFKLSVKMKTDRWGGGNEFIPVYAQVEDYGLSPGGQAFWIRLKPAGGKSPLARGAIQFLRLHLLSKAYPSSEPGDNISVVDKIKMLAINFKEISLAINGFDHQAREMNLCREVNLSQSFIRLNHPTYKKLGGGVRVKRVEVYDNWNKMTAQREAVYGQEYSYTTTEKVNGKPIVISSGVASYEPMIGAEENPFRAPIPYAEKIAPLSPVNNLFSETPLGESFYPSASVGYSQVRVRTINAKAKSANGWQETEFFTTKDFPTLVEHTVLDDEAKRPYNPRLSNFLRIHSLHHLSVSQGFKIELNDMNGKIKSQSSFAENDSVNAISYLRNFYKVDDDRAYQKKLNNNVWVVDSLNGLINKNGIIGKDIEVMVDMREQLSRTIANNYSANIDVSLLGILPGFLPSLLKLPQKEETRFRSAATVKVIQRYGILDSIEARDKGSSVSTKNLVYDSETGEVVLSRTNNEFNDPVYQFSYPAHWAYSGMGMAYKNIDARFSNLRLINGKLYYGNNSTTPFPVERFFESGDEIQLDGTRRTLQSGDNCLFFTVNPIQSLIRKRPLPVKAWVVDASKGKEAHSGLYFIDENGRTLTGDVHHMRILRSGKRNILDASAGSLVSLANPIKETAAGKYKLVLDSNTRVINSQAVTYSDFWKVENSLYKADSCYTKIDTITKYLYPYTSLLMRQYVKNGNSQPIATTANVLNDPHFIASLHNFRNCGKTIEIDCQRTRTYRTKSIIRFDLSSLPDNAQVVSASLNLNALQIKGVWNGNDPDQLSWNNYTRAQYMRGGNLGGRTNAAYLKNVTSPWDVYTGYNNVALGSAQVAIAQSGDESCVSTVLNVNSLITEALGLPSKSYGMMIQLQENNHASKAEELRTTSFCTGISSYDEAQALSISPDESTLQPAAAPIPECAGCVFPVLTVSYTSSKDTCVTICRSNINDSLVNPYRWGILGNWKVQKAYTFYNDRKEREVTGTATNIRKDGELKDFTPFWAFTDAALKENADTTKWVWNSASSLYNKKGFEIENYDPMGRYNSGLYGYNQTLPIAVAQNSKYREILFDGFEDYDYKTKQCSGCSPAREYDFIKNNSNVVLSEDESHTGNFSLKVMAGAEAKVVVPITPLSSDTALASLSFKVDSTPIYNEKVIGAGQGLTALYKGYPSTSCPVIPTSAAQTFNQTLTQGPVDFNWGATSPFTGMCNKWFTVTWKGKVQAPFTDNYRFHALSDWGMSVKVNGAVVVTATRGGVQASSGKVLLQGGALYDIEATYFHAAGSSAYVNLSWSRDENPAIEAIPKPFLYRDNMVPSDSAGSVVRNIRYYCIQLNQPKGQGIIRPYFSPIQKSKMVVSAWVKMDGNDCYTAPALEQVVKATLLGQGQTSVVSLEKTGVRIEGWQRYEAVVTMPADGYELRISAYGPSNRAIYVDDIRMQPFNSQMKSYVYNPVNLRLMAELDENNYAAFYEYDDDGTLIRVKKETEKGVMTIKETRSALVKEN